MSRWIPAFALLAGCAGLRPDEQALLDAPPGPVRVPGARVVLRAPHGGLIVERSGRARAVCRGDRFASAVTRLTGGTGEPRRGTERGERDVPPDLLAELETALRGPLPPPGSTLHLTIEDADGAVRVVSYDPDSDSPLDSALPVHRVLMRILVSTLN